MSEVPRLLFASYHCLIDPGSGAALAMRDLLEGLQRRGWATKAFTGPVLDFERAESPAQILSDQRLPYEVKRFSEGAVRFSLLHYLTGGLPGTIFVPEPNSRLPLTVEMAEVFLALYERVLDQFQPQVLLTYGGQRIGWEMMRRARQRGIRVVFALHNFAYRDAGFFQHADAFLVPSKFCAEHYKRELGLDCTAIASSIDWSRVLCEPESLRREYVTFINPQPNKGVFVFARIAHELGRLRPEIPLLVVEGRGGTDWLARSPVDLSGLKNLHRMSNTPDPRDFYRVTKLLLMPSLWNESFGRVAAEALINGIPVLASNRGSLPEVLADTGFLFDVPARYTSGTMRVPTAEEVAPWIEILLRLWDDAEFHETQSRLCRAAAQKWLPDKVFSRHDEFFRELIA